MGEISIGFLSELSEEEAQALIGKTIEKIEASQYTLTLFFSDGSNLEIEGHCWEDSSLSVNYSG